MDVNTLLPAGIYRIVTAELGRIGPEALTRTQDGNDVSVLPPGAQPDEDQKVFALLYLHDRSIFTAHFSGKLDPHRMEMLLFLDLPLPSRRRLSLTKVPPTKVRRGKESAHRSRNSRPNGRSGSRLDSVRGE